MERILLVEPNYKNKYPPIGLMKMSTYFKMKGAFVEFHKGLMPINEVKRFNKIYITTLFTFDFKICVEAIKYYIGIAGIENVFVGGIAATIMPEKFREAIQGVQMVCGQLLSSKILGYSDDVNIDALELDYDILYDTPYEYQMADSYFIHTTRGCPRKCDFCAVKDLEPEFFECCNITEQIQNVDNKYGIKRRLLIMDNNILYSKNLEKIVMEIYGLGFGKNNSKIKKNNNMKRYMESLLHRIRNEQKYKYLLNKIKKEFLDLKFQRIRRKDTDILQQGVEIIKEKNNFEFIEFLFSHRNFIVTFFERYHYHKITRYVDFNQGLDARLFTKEKAKILSVLNIKPCRIAFDDLQTKSSYFKALSYCIDNGITNFSNYLLYNFKEKPQDLWKRLYLNIQFCKCFPDINLFSFPMKYAAIDKTNRDYIGLFWNRKYLRAMNVILNVTNGIVAKEEAFFLRAFGASEMDFLEILSMPDEFIRFRDFFEGLGLTDEWKKCFNELSLEEKNFLLKILSEALDIQSIREIRCNNIKIQKILSFYLIRKKDIVETKHT